LKWIPIFHREQRKAGKWVAKIYKPFASNFPKNGIFKLEKLSGKERGISRGYLFPIKSE
jgi:hypothetical protein